MRILNISAQKPDSTGSGVYMAEMVRCELSAGHAAAVVAGVDVADSPQLPEGAQPYFVRFNTEALPFNVCGMSDVMPYAATRYRDLTPLMAQQFCQAFSQRIAQAAHDFAPDAVICHHLYLVCAVARETLPNVPMAAVCHSTDLRQMRSHGLEHDRIVAGVRALDAIFALHQAQKDEIVELYGADPEKVHVLGTGYNAQVFSTVAGGDTQSGEGGALRDAVQGASEASETGGALSALASEGLVAGADIKSGKRPDARLAGGTCNLIYAGKIWRKKGVESLISALGLIAEAPNAPRLRMRMAGGYSDKAEYDRICQQAERCPYEIEFLGKLPQAQLAQAYRAADVFVLPSFFEGLPLVTIEALACGCRVVATDLPGVRPWIEANLPGAPVAFVQPPRMQGVDEPVAEDLPAFEARLAEAIALAASQGRPAKPFDTSALSWEALTARAVAQLAKLCH